MYMYIFGAKSRKKMRKEHRIFLYSKTEVQLLFPVFLSNMYVSSVQFFALEYQEDFGSTN
jgi:hypothetical protein